MAEDDPLTRFRRKGDKPEAEQPASPEADNPRFYCAFEAQDKVLRLDIRRTSGESHCPALAYLLDIIYGSRFHTRVVLVFTFMTVTISGKNLREVVQGLRLGKVSAIQEFHPELFDFPADGEPIIERIDVVTGERAVAMREADNMEKQA